MSIAAVICVPAFPPLPCSCQAEEAEGCLREPAPVSCHAPCSRRPRPWTLRSECLHRWQTAAQNTEQQQRWWACRPRDAMTPLYRPSLSCRLFLLPHTPLCVLTWFLAACSTLMRDGSHLETWGSKKVTPCWFKMGMMSSRRHDVAPQLPPR